MSIPRGWPESSAGRSFGGVVLDRLQPQRVEVLPEPTTLEGTSVYEDHDRRASAQLSGARHQPDCSQSTTRLSPPIGIRTPGPTSSQSANVRCSRRHCRRQAPQSRPASPARQTSPSRFKARHLLRGDRWQSGARDTVAGRSRSRLPRPRRTATSPRGSRRRSTGRTRQRTRARTADPSLERVHQHHECEDDDAESGQHAGQSDASPMGNRATGGRFSGSCYSA